MSTPPDGKDRLRITNLKIVHLDNERLRIQREIRDLEGADVITELDRATTDELRIILRWLIDGRQHRRSKAPSYPLQLVEPQRESSSTSTFHQELAQRIEHIVTRRVLLRYSVQERRRQLTLRCRLMRAHQGMLEAKHHQFNPHSIRNYIRWARVAQLTLTWIVAFNKLRAQCYARAAGGGSHVQFRSGTGRGSSGTKDSKQV
jgi:hypothetical protein